MCSITGFKKLKKQYSDDTFHLEYFKNVLQLSVERGRDAFGIAGYTSDDTYGFSNISLKFHYCYEYNHDIGHLIKKHQVCLCNHRAEPTTESKNYTEVTNDMLQPYFSESPKGLYDNFIIVHNGTIANDKELAQELNLAPEKIKIDSQIIGYVLEHTLEEYKSKIEFWKSEYVFDVIEDVFKNKLKGSFACAILYKPTEELFLISNYKPVFYGINTSNDIFYFSSLSHFLELNPKNDYHFPIDASFAIRELKPYSIMKISENGTQFEYDIRSLYPEDYRRKKALIIASAGLDSTTCISWAKEKGYDVELLHFHYECKAQTKEDEAINKIAEYFQVPLVKIPLDFMKNTVGGSTLYTEDSIKHNEDGITGAEFAYEWVPARNLVFLSIAAAYCESKGIDYIILGANLEESGCILNIAENKVRMWDGTQKMPIDVKVGDELLGWNELKNCLDKTVVQEEFKPIHKSYYEIVFTGRQFKNRKNEQVVIKVTGEHPIYVKNKGWVEAKDLKIDDVVMRKIEIDIKQSINDAGDNLKVSEIKEISEEVQTYNYHCEPHNNFFIGNSNILTHNSYPDNEFIFLKKFNDILPNSLNNGNRVQILTPVANLMKKEIVKLGLELKTPYELTWSCYENGDYHCGTCGPCMMRKRAFELNGAKDPVMK